MTTDPTKPGLYGELPTELAPLPTPQRALAIGAHPDDIEFGAGGTLAKWSRQGCQITMLIVTDGSKGSWERDVDPTELIATRIAEQDRAAAALGAAAVRHLDHVDGELVYTMELRAEVCRHIRECAPNVVLSHDPWQRYQLHPDHRATGWAAIDGVIAARDHLFFPEQNLEAHRPDAVLLWSAEAPDHWEDIADTFDSKIAALLCHSSQGTTTMGGADSGDDRKRAFVERMRQWAAQQGEPAGLEAAESFKRIRP